MYEKLYLGQVVISNAGHDKGKYYVIIEATNEYVYLVDGKYKKISNPKKKNKKHIQPINQIYSEIITKHTEGTLLNEDIVKVLREYENRQLKVESDQHTEIEHAIEFPKTQKLQSAIEDAVKSLLVEETEKEEIE